MSDEAVELCLHEAWEENEMGSRRCADCKALLEPLPDPDDLIGAAVNAMKAFRESVETSGHGKGLQSAEHRQLRGNRSEAIKAALDHGFGPIRLSVASGRLLSPGSIQQAGGYDWKADLAHREWQKMSDIRNFIQLKLQPGNVLRLIPGEVPGETGEEFVIAEVTEDAIVFEGGAFIEFDDPFVIAANAAIVDVAGERYSRVTPSAQWRNASGTARQESFLTDVARRARAIPVVIARFL